MMRGAIVEPHFGLRLSNLIGERAAAGHDDRSPAAPS
jgi:hypothetical protein